MKILKIYQRKALAAIVAAFGLQMALLVMATGLGKTVVAARVARLWLRRKKSRILYLVHLWDGIDQAEQEFRDAIGWKTVFQRLDGDGKVDPDAGVVFCTFQTMRNRMHKIPRDAFGLVMVDEGHRSMANTFRPVVEYFQAEFRFAMTATPERMDKRDIGNLFGVPVFNYPLADALANRDLCDLDYQVLTDGVSEGELKKILKKLNRDHRLVTRGMLDRQVFLVEKLDAIVKRIKEAQRTRRKTIIFCRSRRHARVMAKAFPHAKRYVSDIPAAELKETLPAFRAGHVTTLIVVDKLNECVDVPDADHLVFLRGTESSRVWKQQLGRGLRLAPGKKDVLVQDFVANCDRLYDVATLVAEVKNRLRSTDDTPVLHKSGVSFNFSAEARDILAVLKRLERNFYPTIEEFKAATQALGIRTCAEYKKRYQEDPQLPSNPDAFYENWKGWLWVFGQEEKNFYPTLEEFKAAVEAEGLRTRAEYQKHRPKNPRFHSDPHVFYEDWKGWLWVFGKERNFYPTLEKFKAATQALGIRTCAEYRERYQEDPRFPPHPEDFYKKWKGWLWVFGKERKNYYITLKEFKVAIKAQGIRTREEYLKRRREDPRFPSNPRVFYKNWKGWLWVFGRKLRKSRQT